MKLNRLTVAGKSFKPAGTVEAGPVDTLAAAIADVQKNTKLTPEQKERAIELLKVEAKNAEENKKRTGLGLRKFAGMTRGKGSQVVTWEAFDESVPDSLPKDIQQFMDVTNVKSQPDLVALLITGYNDSQYTAASDPIAEFVNDAWPEEAKAQFRVAVRNYSKIPGESIESAANLIRPGFDKAFGTIPTA